MIISRRTKGKLIVSFGFGRNVMAYGAGANRLMGIGRGGDEILLCL